MLTQVDGRKFFTVNEAATALNLPPEVIRNYLHTGKMMTYKFKSLTLLHVDEVQAWKKRQRK